MSILKKLYDENTHTQKIWYKSTMIVYSEMVEDPEKNTGNLFVTFNNGIEYVYKDVDLADYVVFAAGGTEMSQGKALNKIIKSKYSCEKVGPKSLDLLWRELAKIENAERQKSDEKTHTWFISGHRNLTSEEFECVYIPAIDELIENDENVHFIVGDCEGCDIMAQNYLVDVKKFDPDRISVYIVEKSPKYVNPLIHNIISGFKDDVEKDCAMTENSIGDIAFVRDWKIISGTAENILRRNSF